MAYALIATRVTPYQDLKSLIHFKNDGDPYSDDDLKLGEIWWIPRFTVAQIHARLTPQIMQQLPRIVEIPEACPRGTYVRLDTLRKRTASSLIDGWNDNGVYKRLRNQHKFPLSFDRITDAERVLLADPNETNTVQGPIIDKIYNKWMIYPDNQEIISYNEII